MGQGTKFWVVVDLRKQCARPVKEFLFAECKTTVWRNESRSDT